MPARGAGREIEDSPATIVTVIFRLPCSFILKMIGCGIPLITLSVAVLQKLSLSSRNFIYAFFASSHGGLESCE